MQHAAAAQPRLRPDATSANVTLAEMRAADEWAARQHAVGRRSSEQAIANAMDAASQLGPRAAGPAKVVYE